MIPSFGSKGLSSNKVEPITSADSFFGKPELNQSLIASRLPSKCASGCLALRVPDPPSYAPPTICAISKDGKIAAVGGRDVELFLWNTDTGELLATIRGHDIAWTTSHDNTFFVTVQEDSKVFIWDQEQFKQRQLLGHPEEPLTCCSVSLDDMYVVVGGAKGGVYSWDSDSGVEYRQYDDGHTGAVQTVMCYPMEDGSHVIISCGAKDHTIVVWDLETSEKRASIPVDELEHAKNVRYHISKDGTQVLAWCTDSVPFPNLIFVDALNQTKNSVYCHDGLVRHAVFAKDAAKIISCGTDGRIVMWDTLTLEAHLSLAGHTGAVLCCGINEQGDRIVSSGEDCTIRLWSAEDGRQLQLMQSQDEPIKQCAFSKSGDKILTCDVTGRVFVWSIKSEVLLSLIRRFADNLSSVCMSDDHKLLAAGCNTGRIMLWDVDQRENVWDYSHHTGRVESVAFNSLKSLIAAAGADGRITLIAVDSGKQVNSYIGVNEPIMSIAFSPDDERLAGCSADGKLLLYQTNTNGRKPKLVLRNNIARITSFIWSPNSKLIAGCGSDGCVMVWNAQSGSIFTVLEGQNGATCCVFDYIGKLLAVGTLMGTTVLYNLETAEALCDLRCNASAVTEVVFSQDTSRLTTICSRQAIIWDVATTQKVRIFDFVVDKLGEFQSQPHPVRTAVAHSGTVLFDHESEAVVYDMLPPEDPSMRSYYLSDTRTIISGNNHRHVMVWSAAGNTAPDKFHTTHDAITSCHFSQDERLVVMGTQDGNIVVYDVLHNETVEVILAHQNGPCRCVRLSHDNTEVLSCGADAKVILWDWRRRSALRIYSGHFISIGCCDMAFQGNRVVSGDNHGMISVFERETGNSVQTLPLAHSKAVLSVSMSADGSTVASVGADDKVSIWNVDLGLELVSLTAAIESRPLYCAFSPDGNKLAVTENNGNVLIWNTIAGCQWYMISQAHQGKVTSCSWSFDCRRLVTAGTDSMMAIWDSESGAPMFKFNVRAGPLTTVAVSPQGVYVAAGSMTGTLSVCNIPMASRNMPEPSFLFHWLSKNELKQAQLTFRKLAAIHPHLANVQDAQGWSVINHAMASGSPQVAAMVLESLPAGCGSLGLISSVPFTIQTRVRFHSPADPDGLDGEVHPPRSTDGSITGGMAAGMAGYGPPPDPALPSIAARMVLAGSKGRSISSRKARRQSIMGPLAPPSPNRRSQGQISNLSVGAGTNSSTHFSRGSTTGPSGGFGGGFGGGGSLNKSMGMGMDVHPSGDSILHDVVIQQSARSFSHHVKKVAVELFTEKPNFDQLDLLVNNALALALNSKSSECVQILLDAAAENKVSWGSYHAITDMMPSLAVRYPFMCYQFLASLELQKLGDLEVPVDVIKDLNMDSSIIRTAPIFTNVKMLWQSHLNLHNRKSGQQPYAHVQASMVRLPFACSVGKESLLQTLVESDVPVKVYGTATVRAVIWHKWRLYGRQRLTIRAVVYCLYTLLTTLYAVLYASEDASLSISDYWASAGSAKVHCILDGYLFAQTAWYGWVEISQIWAMGLVVYAKSAWNALDMLTVVLMLIIPVMHILRLSNGPGEALSPMVAFTVIFVYTKLFFYALAFEPTGKVVHMLFKILYAVRSWVSILFMSIISFGTSLMVLYQYAQPDAYQEFSSFGNMLLTMWAAVNYQFNFFTSAPSTYWNQLGLIFVSTFMFLVHIVLINMLIALMRDIYQQIRDSEEESFLKGRAMLIVEVEALMAKKQLEMYALMPPFVHLLTPVHRHMGKDVDLASRLDRVETIVTHLRDAISHLARGGHLGSGANPNLRATANPANPGVMTGTPRGLPAIEGSTGSLSGTATVGNISVSFAGNFPGGPAVPSYLLGHQPGAVGGPGAAAGGLDAHALALAQQGYQGHMGAAMDPGQAYQLQDQYNLVLQAQRLRDSDLQLPAILRQLDRLQRAVNNQEMRMEGIIMVLRDIENLLRNQQPVVMHAPLPQEAPRQARRGSVLTEAELEQEVKRLLGHGDDRL